MGTLQDNECDLPPNVVKSIQEICKREGYFTYNLNCKVMKVKGSCYLGKLYQITAKEVTKDVEKETHFFVKSILTGEKLDPTLNLRAAYATEAYVYNELSKIFNEIQEDAGISPQDRYKMIKSYDESDSTALYLENVEVKGYRTFDTHYVMDMNVAKLALEQLAKFHALTFALEKQRPECFLKLKKITTPFTLNAEWESSVSHIAGITMKHSCMSEETAERFRKILPELVLKWKRYLLSNESKCCLCHGDFRLSNLVMKETNGKASDLIIIDYQLAHYGSPIDDFFYFIFLGTDQEFRQKNLETLRDFYYDNFRQFLKKFSLDAEEIYPRKEFNRDFEERKDYGLISALVFMPFALVVEGDMPDVGEESVDGLDFHVHDSFPERMEGIIDDFIKSGYL